MADRGGAADPAGGHRDGHLALRRGRRAAAARRRDRPLRAPGDGDAVDAPTADPEDGRATLAVLTDAGWDEVAAPVPLASPRCVGWPSTR